MKAKNLSIKKFGKQDRERKVLLGLIDYYLQTGKPVGSHTLQEAGFGDLSTATIRNYFVRLEEEGYLKQLHSSAGRIPTNLAYRLYANEHIDNQGVTPEIEKEFKGIRQAEMREIALFLQQSVEKLTQFSRAAIFLSAPRFDHDFVLDIKLVSIDQDRCLCVLITDFGLVQTELLHVDTKLSSFSISRIEHYFRWKLTGQNKPENLKPEEEALAQNLYNEVMVRYIVRYSTFADEDIYRTGFSQLLSHSEFSEGIGSSLALFENAHSLRMLIRECCKMNKTRFWIGEDLDPFAVDTPSCAIISVPYYINQKVVGAVGLLGPTRMPYKNYFGMLRHFSECISEGLTNSLYKFKLTFRQPNQPAFYFPQQEQQLIGNLKQPILLEDKT